MSPKISFSRVKQLTGSYCGPAVFEMLLSGMGRKLDQEEMVDASGARKTVMKEGIPLIQLATGLRRLYPDLVVWGKSDSKVSDLTKLLSKGYLVAIDWQGIFSADEYEDDEESKLENLIDRITKAPVMKGTQGHYCIALEINKKKGYLRFADPYGHYAGKDRFVALWEFEERWWDDRIDRDEVGRKKYVLENRLMFVVAKKGDTTPKKLGMEEV